MHFVNLLWIPLVYDQVIDSGHDGTNSDFCKKKTCKRFTVPKNKHMRYEMSYHINSSPVHSRSELHSIISSRQVRACVIISNKRIYDKRTWRRYGNVPTFLKTLRKKKASRVWLTWILPKRNFHLSNSRKLSQESANSSLSSLLPRRFAL